MRAYNRSLLCLLFTFLIIGCGRVTPEGYAPVRIQLGQDRSLNLMNELVFPGGAIGTVPDVACETERLVLSAFGPGMDRPIHHLIGGDLRPRINITQLAAVQSGSIFQQVPEISLLVPKGPERRFVVSGFLRAVHDFTNSVPKACLSQTAIASAIRAYPIFGGTPAVNIDQRATVSLKAWIHSKGFQVQQTTDAGGNPIATEIDITGTPFVALNVNWDFLTNESIYIHVRSLFDDISLTSLDGLMLGPIQNGKTWRLAPLIPGRKYEITLRKSGATAAYRYYYEPVLEPQEQAISIGLADMIVVPMPL